MARNEILFTTVNDNSPHYAVPCFKNDSLQMSTVTCNFIGIDFHLIYQCIDVRVKCHSR